MSKSRGRGGKGNGKRVARVGAAAFALGLSLAGPQVGSAAADATEDGSTASSNSRSTTSTSSGSDSAKASSPRAGRPQASVPRRGTKAARSVEQRVESADVPAGAGERAPGPAAAVSAPRAAAAAREGRGAGADGDPGRAESASAAGPAPSAATPAASAAEAVVPALATPVAAVVAGSGPDLAASDAPAVVSWARGGPWAAAKAAAPKTLPAPAIPGTPLMRTLHNNVQKFFIDFSDLVRRLPAGPLQDLAANLEGALLMLRRTFFDHAPTAGPHQDTVSSTQITGHLNGFDGDGDALTYAVIEGPLLGTVELAEDGAYTYLPGADFAGSDSFTVQVNSSGSGINLFHLLAHPRFTQVVVEVGDAAASHPFGQLSGVLTSTPAVGSVAPAALFLGDTPAVVSVTRNALGGLTGTVTLTLPADTEVGWFYNSNSGGMALSDAAKHWKAIEAGSGDITFGVVFADTSNAPQTVIMESVTATKGSAPGAYVFSGTLVDPDAANGAGIDSIWDLTGPTAKTGYVNFRRTWIDVPDFSGATFSVANADIFADSYSVSQYGLAVAETPEATADRVMPANVLEMSKGDEPGTSDDVFALVDDGAGGYFVGTGKGQVLHYFADGSQVDLSESGWSSPVTTMTVYGSYEVFDSTPVGQTIRSPQPVEAATNTIVDLGAVVDVATLYEPVIDPANPPRGISGVLSVKGWTDPTGASVDLAYLYLIQKTADGKSVQVVVEGYPPVTTLDGVTFNPPTVLVSGLCPSACSNSPTTINRLYVTFANTTDVSSLANATVTSTLSYYQPDGYSMSPGIVVGLGNGAVKQWTPGPTPADKGTWKELLDSSQSTAVTTLMPYKGRPDVCAGGCDGFVAGFSDGSVWQYNEARDGAGKPGWYVLHDKGWQSAVRAMIPYGTDGVGLPTFVVGLANGAIERWDGGVFKEVADSANGDIWYGGNGFAGQGQPMIPFGDDFIVGQADGAIIRYSENADGSFAKTTLLQANPEYFLTDFGPLGKNDYMTVTTIVPWADGFVYGNRGGAVGRWNPSEWTGTVDWRCIAGGSGCAVPAGAQAPGFTRIKDWRIVSYGATDVSAANVIIPFGSGLAIGVQTEDYGGSEVWLWDGTGSARAVGPGSAAGTTKCDGWCSDVTAMLPTGTGFVVGLADGAIETWSAVSQGWSEVRGNIADVNQLKDYYTWMMGGVPGFEDPAKAVLNDLFGFGLIDYSFNDITTVAPNQDEMLSSPSYDASGNWISGDPLFGAIAPACTRNGTCDGTAVTFALATPVSYWIEKWQSNGALEWQQGAGFLNNFGNAFRTCNNAAFCASVDAGVLVSGYVVVPNSLWEKLSPAYWAMGLQITATTGPAIRMNLDETVGSTSGVAISLTSDPPPYESFVYEPTAYGVFAIDGQVSANVSIGLGSSNPDLKRYKGVAYGTVGVGVNHCGAFKDGCDSGVWVDGFGTVSGWKDFLTTNELKLALNVTPAVKFKYGVVMPGKWTEAWNKVPVIGSTMANLFNLDLYVGLQDKVSIGLDISPVESVLPTLSVTSKAQFIVGIDPPSSVRLIYQALRGNDGGASAASILQVAYTLAGGCAKWNLATGAADADAFGPGGTCEASV